MKHARNYKEIIGCANRTTPGYSALRWMLTTVFVVSLVWTTGCRHTSTETALDTGGDFGRSSYTPRTQKDVKELINLVHKPL